MRRITNLLVFIMMAGGSVLAFAYAHDHLSPSARYLAYTGLYVAIACAGLWLYKDGRPLDPFAPALPSFGLLYVYSAASALNATDKGTTVLGSPVDTAVMKLFYVSCLVGLLGLCIGFVLGQSTRLGVNATWNLPRRLPDHRLVSRLAWAAPLLGIICVPWVRPAFDFVHVTPYSEWALAGRVAKAQMGSSQPLKEVFLHDVPIALLLMLAVLLLFRARSGISRLVGLSILLPHLATALLGGQRHALAMVGTVTLVFVNYRVRRITPVALLAMLLAGMVLISAMSFLRQTSNPLEMMHIGLRAVAERNTAILQFSQYGEFLTGQNLMRLISGIRDRETSYTYGSSVVTELLVFVPRALYPGRPLPLSERFVDTFYPGVRETGGGYGFFYLMEGYWALGIPGVLVFMVVYACLVQWIYKSFVAGQKTDAMVLWYGYVIYALVFVAVRSGIIALFKIALMYSLPFLLLACIPDFRLRRRSPQTLDGGDART